MSTIRVSTFDTEKIRSYMEGSSVLTTGIAYIKVLTPWVSDEVAKETAIREAQNICQRKWANDSTGYIANEYMAWQDFVRDVQRGSCFSVSYAEKYGPNAKHSPKNRWVCLALAFFLGIFGAHRFYVGKWKTGLFWLFTGGGFGFGCMYDLFVLLFGSFEDADGLILK